MSARRRKPKGARKPRATPAPAPLLSPGPLRLGQVADSVLAKQLGVSTYRIKQERQARGIGPFVPRLAQGLVKDVIKTIRLTPAEEEAQLAAADSAGVEWGAWIRGLGNAEAARQAKLEALWQSQGRAKRAGGTKYHDDDLLSVGGQPVHATPAAARHAIEAGADAAVYLDDPDSVEAGESDELIAKAHAANRGTP